MAVYQKLLQVATSARSDVKISILSENGTTIVVKYTVEFALISVLYWHYKLTLDYAVTKLLLTPYMSGPAFSDYCSFLVILFPVLHFRQL